MQPWGVGDRVADVRLEVAGVEHVLHRDFAGAPLWLWRASGAMSRPPEIPADAVAMAFGGAPAAPWRPASATQAWLDQLAPGRAYRLDANLRVRAIDTGPTPASEPMGLAPVLVIPGVFEREFCAALVAHLEHECAGGTPSGVLVVEGGAARLVQDRSIKQRRESPVRDLALEQAMHARLLRRALPEISRTFQFDVQRRDPFKLLAYPADAGYFRAHRDNDSPDVAHRRFALSVNLDADAYTGGAFAFPEFGGGPISPPTGAALVFSCSLLHEVLPVTAGTRHAMTTFLA